MYVNHSAWTTVLFLHGEAKQNLMPVATIRGLIPGAGTQVATSLSCRTTLMEPKTKMTSFWNNGLSHVGKGVQFGTCTRISIDFGVW
jgi:hypothetical protein